MARDAAGVVGGAQSRSVLSEEGLGAIFPSPAIFGGGATDDGAARANVPAVLSNDLAGRHHRLRLWSSGPSRLSSPRLLSAEERTLLLIFCRDHQVAECVRRAGRFHLREVASPDSFGVRTHGCPRCQTDLTDSIRAHLYGCAMLPVAVRRKAQAAREAARSLVKQSHQSRDAADVAVREVEAALHALREMMRQSARTTNLETVCLPDTFDPRGPKK